MKEEDFNALLIVWLLFTGLLHWWAIIYTSLDEEEKERNESKKPPTGGD